MRSYKNSIVMGAWGLFLWKITNNRIWILLSVGMPMNISTATFLVQLLKWKPSNYPVVRVD